MKKKSFVVLCLLIAAIGALSASVIQIGPVYSVDFPIDLESSTPVEFDKIPWNKFKLGAELRLNLGFLTLEESVGASFTEKLLLESFDISSLAGVNFGFTTKVFGAGMVIGAGLRTRAVKSGENWIYNGLYNPTALETVMSSTLFYKAALDLTFGKAVTLSFAMVTPTTQSINSLTSVQNISVVDALTPSLKDTTLSVGLLFNLL